jgi:hypothetical protein
MSIGIIIDTFNTICHQWNPKLKISICLSQFHNSNLNKQNTGTTPFTFLQVQQITLDKFKFHCYFL